MYTSSRGNILDGYTGHVINKLCVCRGQCTKCFENVNILIVKYAAVSRTVFYRSNRTELGRFINP